MSRTLLLADDDAATRAWMRRGLERRGYGVLAASTGREALALARELKPDAALIDVHMAGEDGFAVCRDLRAGASTCRIPVILISGVRTMDRHVVGGLRSGADDYILKPVSLGVLHAKIEALLRRTPREGGEAPLRVADVDICIASRRAVRGGRVIALTRREFDLLAALAARPGRVLSQLALLEAAWEADKAAELDPHTVETHVSQLRRKLGREAAARIVTVRRCGYRLDPQ